MVREIDSPTPMPCRFVVTNGWNSRDATSGEMPQPVSATSTTTILSSAGLVETLQLAAFGGLHGLQSVAQQIEQHLLNLDLVDKNEVN